MKHQGKLIKGDAPGKLSGCEKSPGRSSGCGGLSLHGLGGWVRANMD